MSDQMVIALEDHPLLRVASFVTSFPAPLAEMSSPGWLLDRLGLKAASPVHADPELRSAIREMLRFGGYKPSGRGKPASEYLLRAAGDDVLSSINLAVDACNAVSLQSGFPISVVDLDVATPPFRIAIASTGTTYVFNASGQEIALSGLVCLFDAEGACANAVRDSQRTKTRPETSRTLSVIWGAAGYEARIAGAIAEYMHVLESAGARTARSRLAVSS